VGGTSGNLGIAVRPITGIVTGPLVSIRDDRANTDIALAPLSPLWYLPRPT